MRFGKPTFALLSLICVGAVLLAAFSNRRPYSRIFGSHVVEIWISADDAGSSQQKIHGSYSPRFALMRGYKSVNLPEHFETPTFTTIQEPTDNLFCIYDNNGYGFLMLVDQSDHEWAIGGKAGGSLGFSPHYKWSKRFANLRNKHPEVPYWHYLSKSQKESDNKVIDPSGG